MKNSRGALSPGLHGTTFGGGPLICATALEALKIIEDEKLMQNARERGAELTRWPRIAGAANSISSAKCAAKA